MARDDDDEDVETTMASGNTPVLDPMKELDGMLDDFEMLLKNGDFVAALSQKGVNASLALLATSGMRALFANRKEDAAEDFATLAEELRARAAGGSGPANSGGAKNKTDGRSPSGRGR